MLFLHQGFRIFTLAAQNPCLQTFMRHLRSAPSILTAQPQPVPNDSKFCEQEVMPSRMEIREHESRLTRDVMAKINEQIQHGTHGRLFAVVRIFGKQFKITTEDIIVLQNYFIPDLGDSINLKKILLVGASDFTLFGRPVLDNNLVKIDATVMEKTYSHVVTSFTFKKRKNFRRIRHRRIPYTMLRINNIEFTGLLNETSPEETIDKLLTA